MPRIHLHALVTGAVAILGLTARPSSSDRIDWNTSLYPSGGNWNAANCWMPHLPGITDEVVIPTGVTVTHSPSLPNSHTVDSITGPGTLILSGGTLDVTTTVASTLTFKITGGTLINATIEGTLTYSGGNFGHPPAGTLSGVSLSAGAVLEPQLDAGLTIIGGLELASSSVLKIGHVGGGGHVVFSGPGSLLSGDGEVRFVGDPSGASRSLSLEAEVGTVLEIGPGITIKTSVPAGPGGGRVGAASTTTINYGTVFAQARPITLGGSWENNGVVRCASGINITANGTYTQTLSGTLDIEVTASGQPRLLSSGVLKFTETALPSFPLAGALTITPVDAYVPCHRDTFKIMEMRAVGGANTNWGADPPGSPGHFIGQPGPPPQCGTSSPCDPNGCNDWRLHYHLKPVAQPRMAYLLLDAVAVPTDANDPASQGIPARFHAYPSAPNPFNPSTTIRFDLPTRSKIDLSIFDIAGRRVRQLLGGTTYNAGSHTVRWDGRDDEGVRLSSGIYFYRFAAGRYIATQRIVLLK